MSETINKSETTQVDHEPLDSAQGKFVELEKANDQAVVVDVVFKRSRKVYTFEIDDLDIEPGTAVVAESEMGPYLGYVLCPRYTINRPEQPLKKVIRIATEEDIEADRENKPFEEEAKAFCIERVKSRNLLMKIVATETTLDRKRLIFYFTADGRIDFRELVRDLAGRFKTRIEMRQIGVRDEVKIIGGIGVCGRVTCCSSFLTTFEPISIRMAKQQELALSQSKLSGICGRLMCCIAYEYEDSEDQTSLTIPESDKTQKCSKVEEKTSELPKLVPASIKQGEEDISVEEVIKHPPCQGVCHITRGEQVEKQEKETTKEYKDTHRKRHFHQKAQKKDNKGKPFSKRKQFWGKKRH